MPTYAAAFIARRSGGNGHIGGLVRQLDEVLYASFVASYILDANFLNFVVRCICRSRQLPAMPEFADAVEWCERQLNSSSLRQKNTIQNDPLSFM